MTAARVLVAGLEPTKRASVVGALASRGWEVAAVDDLGELESAAAVEHADLIVIPSNVFEVARTIKKRSAARIVMVFANAHPMQLEYALTQGADATAMDDDTGTDVVRVIAEMLGDSAESTLFPDAGAATETVIGGATIAGNAVSVGGTLEAAQIASVQDALSEVLGPIAQVLMKRTVPLARDKSHLVELLASHVESDAERTKFLMAVRG